MLQNLNIAWTVVKCCNMLIQFYFTFCEKDTPHSLHLKGVLPLWTDWMPIMRKSCITRAPHHKYRIWMTFSLHEMIHAPSDLLWKKKFHHKDYTWMLGHKYYIWRSIFLYELIQYAQVFKCPFWEKLASQPLHWNGFFSLITDSSFWSKKYVFVYLNQFSLTSFLAEGLHRSEIKNCLHDI